MIKYNGVETMEQGIIIYQDPKEFLKVIEQLQEAYNKSKYQIFGAITSS